MSYFWNFGKFWAEHMRKEPRNQMQFNPCCLELKRLICEGWWLVQNQYGSKDNAIQSNYIDHFDWCLTSRTVSFTLSFQSYYDVYIDYDNIFHCEPMFPTSFQFHVNQIFKLIARYIMTVSLSIELMLDINFNLIVNLCIT